MIRLVFIEPSDERREIAAAAGQSVMQAATDAGVDGIDAECGGSCMCATCHCLVVEAAGPLPEVDTAEAETLEFTAEQMQDNSRLTCQLQVAAELDGAVFQVVGR